MRKPFGLSRLDALAAPDVWQAHMGLMLYAVEPHSITTVAVGVAGLQSGGVAGMVLFRRPYAWLGMERSDEGFAVAQFDEQRGRTVRVPLGQSRVWLRVACDFSRGEASFGYSTDGHVYAGIGEPYHIGQLPSATRGIPCSLFSHATTLAAGGGFADFDSFLAFTGRAP